MQNQKSPSTIRTYQWHARKFLEWFKSNPSESLDVAIAEFLQTKKISKSLLKQRKAALGFRPPAKLTDIERIKTLENLAGQRGVPKVPTPI